MAVVYTFSEINDFLNQKVDTSRLLDEITKSSITIALERIDTIDDDVNIYFKSALSGAEELVLQQIVNTHTGEPYIPNIPSVPVYIDIPRSEKIDEQNFLIGRLRTRDTDANQIILSYTIPNDKMFYLMSFSVANEGGSDGTVYIGKLPLGTVPNAPGSITSNIFRCFRLDSREKANEVSMQPNPRKLGDAGETIVVTVTPDNKSSTYWIANLDFILR